VWYNNPGAGTRDSCIGYHPSLALALHYQAFERNRYVAFSGFTQSDFDIFELPDFATRMPALKSNLTPKLKELGAELTPRLTELYGQTLHPHVALHLRRSVNTPVSTWVAFAKEKRGYKPYVHLRAAITGDEFRCLVFVEDYAEEKELFADNLAKNAAPLSSYLKSRPTIKAYTVLDRSGEPLKGDGLSRKVLKDFAERMKRVKGQHAVFGIAFNRSHPVVQSGPGLADALVEAAKELKPLYDCGSAKNYRFKEG